jgi:hypothetical protein
MSWPEALQENGYQFPVSYLRPRRERPVNKFTLFSCQYARTPQLLMRYVIIMVVFLFDANYCSQSFQLTNKSGGVAVTQTDASTRIVIPLTTCLGPDRPSSGDT